MDKLQDHAAIPSNGVHIQVDAGKSIGHLQHFWNYIGYDECNYTHTPEGERLLAEFGNLADAPYFVRAHHLFCNGNGHGTYKWGSTNVYTEDEQGNPVYNWEILDEILDIYLRTGNKPFFEIGFMPMELADPAYWSYESDWQRYGAYRQQGWSAPPKDYDKWHDLVYHTVRHCVDRYGKDEVLTWYWELWNEPDIFYWRGSDEEFFKLFDYTEAAVHAALPEARLGGPSTTGPMPGSKSQQFLDRFMDHCKKGNNYVSGAKGTRLDYITFHVKGGGFPFQPNALKATPSVRSFIAQAKTGMETIRKYGFQDKEIVLSEADPDGWAAGGVYDNPNMIFRNTEYFASYVASSYHQLSRLVDTMEMDVRPLAWTFLFVAERCFEGTRSFATQGIHKAVFNLFKLLSRLGNRRLALTSSGSQPLGQTIDDCGHKPDVDGLAALTDDGRMQVLIYSHHDERDLRQSTEIVLQLDHMIPGGRYRLVHYRVDAEHSNAYREWVAQGSPKYPEGDPYAAIKARDGLELYEDRKEIEVENGQWSHRFTLPAHGISLIELVPLE